MKNSQRFFQYAGAIRNIAKQAGSVVLTLDDIDKLFSAVSAGLYSDAIDSVNELGSGQKLLERFTQARDEETRSFDDDKKHDTGHGHEHK